MGFFSRVYDKVVGGLQRALGRNSFGGIFPLSQTAPPNEFNALALSTVHCAVTTIANYFAGMPIPVYEVGDKGKRRATDYFLWDLLNGPPNPDMCQFTYRHTVAHHFLLWTDSFSQIVHGGDGYAQQLIPLMPNRVIVNRDNDTGEILYQVFPYPSGPAETLSANEILHIPGLSFDGIRGLPLILLARRSLDMSRNAEEFGASFFHNAAVPSGVIEYPGKLSTTARANLEESWRRQYLGPKNAGSVPVLEEGAAFRSIQSTPEAGQWNLTRDKQTIEICRWFNIPPPYVHELGRATWSNLESLNVTLYQQTLFPWCQRYEQEVNRKLVPRRDRGKFVPIFDAHSLLRGDSKTLAVVNNSYVVNGIKCPNEARADIGLDPIEGGDTYRVPVTQAPTNEAPPDEEDKPTTEEESNDTEQGV